MGTTAEKLTYLNGTKRLLRRRLNSLGAEITLDTKFRDYLLWLNRFYEAASAPFSFELKGETELKPLGVAGKNLLPLYDGEIVQDGVTVTISDGGKITLNGTATSTIYVKLTNGIEYSHENPASASSESHRWKNEEISDIEGYGTFEVFRGGGSYTAPTPAIGQPTLSFTAYTHINSSTADSLGGTLPTSGNEYKCTSIYYSQYDTSLNSAIISIPAGTSFTNYWCYIQFEDSDTTLSTATYEPYYAASPPSPDNPKQIVNLTGRVLYTSKDGLRTFPINLSTRNLVKNTKSGTTTLNGLTFTVNEDKSVTVNGTATDLTKFIICDETETDITDGLVGKDLILNGSPLDADVYKKLQLDIDSATIVNAGTGDTQFTFPSTFTHWSLSIVVTANQTVENMVFKPMIRPKGDNDATYEPYYDINIELCGNPDPNGRVDRIYYIDGSFKLERNITSCVFNGVNESWYYNSTNDVYSGALKGEWKYTPSNYGVSNYFKNIYNPNIVDYATAGANLNNGEFAFSYHSSGIDDTFYLKYTDLDETDIVATVAALKAWLSTHNTIIQYEKEEPEEFVITAEEYPTLYKQLQAIADYETTKIIEKKIF